MSQPTLVENPSFENPPQADGLPRGRYHIGYPRMKEKPVGGLSVTDEAAHSGRFPLKWDLGKVADAESAGRGPRWLTVNVGLSGDTVKSLRGKRVQLGYWLRLGGGTTVPGLESGESGPGGPGRLPARGHLVRNIRAVGPRSRCAVSASVTASRHSTPRKKSHKAC